MTRIIASGDQHIDAAHLTTRDDQGEAMVALFEAARKADVLLLLGDATHTRRPSPYAFSLWGEQLARIEEDGVEVVALKGNHDDDAAIVHTFEKFRGKIEVATTPRLIRLRSVDVACLPWLPDTFVRASAAGTRSREEIAHELTTAAVAILRGFAAQRHAGVPLILATHATIAGAETSSGWNMGYRPSTQYVLPIEELEGFDLTLAGHIHRHQTILGGLGSIRAIYTGSLLPLDFSETEDKGYVEVEIDKPRAGFTWSFRPVPTPKVNTYELHGRDAVGEFVSLTPSLHGVFRPALWRIRAHVDEATAREFPAAWLEDVARKAGARMAQAELIIARSDRARDAGTTDELEPTGAFDRWLDKNDITEGRDRIRDCAIVSVADVALEPRFAGTGAGDVRITRLEAQDFLGLAHADVDLSGVDVATLYAPVGMGKSSVGCDVIRFALFGESRIGGKASDRLIRQGADAGHVAVEITTSTGHRYRIVRKLKRGASGRVSTTLDVLEDKGEGVVWWSPISTGKIADGEASIGRILGGLSDATLTTSSLVVQRDADRFTAARPEERKRVIAEAAALDVYDQLATAAQDRRKFAESELEKLQAEAMPLRARAAALPRLEDELAAARTEQAGAKAEVERLEEQGIALREEIEKLTAQARDFAVIVAQFRAADDELLRLTTSRAQWDGKLAAAKTALARRPLLERAKVELGEVRASIATLEAQTIADGAAGERRRAALTEQDKLSREFRGMRERRERELALAERTLEARQGQKKRLHNSECPIIERIPGEFAPCVFLRDAVVDASLIGPGEGDVERLAEPSVEEFDVEKRMLEYPVPDAADVGATLRLLDDERHRARNIEARLGWADEIAIAEQVERDHDVEVPKLDAAITEKKPKWSELQESIRAAQKGGAPDELLVPKNRVLRLAEDALRLERSNMTAAAQRVGVLEGRVQTMHEAKDELATLEERIRENAENASAWVTTAAGWRACRVLVLESSVIPSLEDHANEVLRFFPYGLQVRFATQRELKGGEGVAETLEIEVLGPGQVYELLSGGQKTTVDLAFHVALALVVSRRLSTRLRFLYLDEPEGLDDAGRAALAGLVRWIADTHGLTVVLASHHDDLIDAVGGVRIPFSGVPGDATVGATE